MVHIVIEKLSDLDDTTKIVGVFHNIEKARTCFENLLDKYDVMDDVEYTNALQDLYYSGNGVELHVESWGVA